MALQYELSSSLCLHSSPSAADIHHRRFSKRLYASSLHSLLSPMLMAYTARKNIFNLLDSESGADLKSWSISSSYLIFKISLPWPGPTIRYHTFLLKTLFHLIFCCLSILPGVKQCEMTRVNLVVVRTHSAICTGLRFWLPHNRETAIGSRHWNAQTYQTELIAWRSTDLIMRPFFKNVEFTYRFRYQNPCFTASNSLL